MEKPKLGSIGWVDLTVEDASAVSNFYQSVAGWGSQKVEMGGYSDYNLLNSEGQAVCGVCHQRGGNAGLPSQWLIYITVEDIQRSLSECRRLGGKVVAESKQVPGYGTYCVIRDPAGAVAALFQPQD